MCGMYGLVGTFPSVVMLHMVEWFIQQVHVQMLVPAVFRVSHAFQQVRV